MKQDNAIKPRITIADRFEEARALFLREKVPLPGIRRRSRRNDFVRTLDRLGEDVRRRRSRE